MDERAADLLIDALVNIRAELRFFGDVAGEFGLDLNAISPEDGVVLYPPATGSGTGANTGGAGPKSGTGCVPSSGGNREADGASGCPEAGLGACCGSREGGKPGTSAGRGDPEKGGTIFFGPNRTTRAYVDLFMSAGSSGVSLLEGLTVLWATEECYLRSWRYAASFVGEKEDGAAGEGSADADGGAMRTRFIPNWSSKEFEGFVRRIGDVVDELHGRVKGAEEGELMRGRCLEWWRQVIWLEERFWPTIV